MSLKRHNRNARDREDQKHNLWALAVLSVSPRLNGCRQKTTQKNEAEKTRKIHRWAFHCYAAF